MAWERRKRGGSYFTQSKRVDSWVVRMYIGGGELGRIASQSDADRHTLRKAQRQHERAELERLEALAAPVCALCETSGHAILY